MNYSASFRIKSLWKQLSDLRLAELAYDSIMRSKFEILNLRAMRIRKKTLTNPENGIRSEMERKIAAITHELSLPYAALLLSLLSTLTPCHVT